MLPSYLIYLKSGAWTICDGGEVLDLEIKDRASAIASIQPFETVDEAEDEIKRLTKREMLKPKESE